MAHLKDREGDKSMQIPMFLLYFWQMTGSMGKLVVKILTVVVLSYDIFYH